MQDGAMQSEWIDKTVVVLPREYVLEVSDAEADDFDPPPPGGSQSSPRPPPSDVARITVNVWE